MKKTKITSLPEEYIVECKNANEAKEVNHFYYNDDITYHWEYIICRKCYKLSHDHRAISSEITEENKHLPILSYDEWYSLVNAKTYTLDELQNNDNVVVFIETEEQWKQLKETGMFRMAPHFCGAYCYSLYQGTFVSNSTKTNAGQYRGKEIVQFNQIIFNKPKTETMKKQPFAITGSTVLKEAFIKEAKLSVYNEDTINYYYLIPDKNKKNSVIGAGCNSDKIEFVLPKDYEAAMNYVKEYWKEEEFKAGDWLVYCEKAPKDCAIISINLGGCYKFNGLAVVNEKGKSIPLKGICDITNCFRKATEEEIKKATELPNMAGYEAKVSEGKLHYGCKEFSKEEINTIIAASGVLEKFSAYGASLSSTDVIAGADTLSIGKLKSILPKLA